jgi:hypothetical protein
MKVVYHVRSGRRLPDYLCDGRTVNDPQPVCQWISGADVDSAVSEVLVGIMTPVAIEVTLAVQQELQARLDEVDRLRKQQVERARYEAELAQRRYMRVDPDNRLVADTLEADWNRNLRSVQEAQQEYEQQRQHDRVTIDEELRARLHTLSTEFPRLWRDPETPDRERKPASAAGRRCDTGQAGTAPHPHAVSRRSCQNHRATASAPRDGYAASCGGRGRSVAG